VVGSTVQHQGDPDHYKKLVKVFQYVSYGARNAIVGLSVHLLRKADERHRPGQPADACKTWRTLYQGLEVFHGDLLAHVHLENDVLFVHALPP